MMGCPKCGNILNISKKIPEYNKDEQSGGSKEIDIDNFINDVLEDNYNNITNYDLEDIQQSESYISLTSENKQIINNALTNKTQKNDKQKKNRAYYVCGENCRYFTEIMSKTKIYEKYPEQDSLDATLYNINDKKYDQTCFRTKEYKCPNSSCDTHKTPKNKEAIFYRINDKSYQLRFICTSCNTNWRN